jgi:hypothetical protein
LRQLFVPEQVFQQPFLCVLGAFAVKIEFLYQSLYF